MSTEVSIDRGLSHIVKPEVSDGGGLATTVSALADAGKAMCQEAYEHRTEIGIAAGTAALGALALVAAGPQLARLLPTAGKDVLLVEDTPYMGKALKSALEQNGERVTWVTGVKRAFPLTGTTLEGGDVVINPRKFKLAFLDADLKGSYLQGEHVAHALHQDGVKIIGTSTIKSLNETLLANGADMAAPKPTVLTALVNNQLDLSQAINSPLAAQQRLDFLTGQIKGKSGEAMRERAGDVLRRFMAEEKEL